MQFNTDDNNIRFIIESAMAKMEKANFRLWIAILLLIVALVGSNAAWIWYESQWKYVESSSEISQSLEADGDAIINDGVHINDENNSKRQTDN